ncbi:hypothetical protein DFH06DRAFT_1483723 [Mycena polygramma]|nr:hypothetical protein DFH06DRAFT_1483723 [Mycena polygramma]
MPHPQSTSLSTHSTVPPFASHSIATSWQSAVGESMPGMEHESATDATANDGSEWHATATTVYDGMVWPIWDAETLAFFAMHTGPSSADGSFDPLFFASLSPLDRPYPELYSPVQFPAPYEAMRAS